MEGAEPLAPLERLFPVEPRHATARPPGALPANGGSGTATPTKVVSVRGSLPSDAAVGTTETATTDATQLHDEYLPNGASYLSPALTLDASLQLRFTATTALAFGGAGNPRRAGASIFPEPLAYLLTWTTYGTWLPGDERG